VRCFIAIDIDEKTKTALRNVQCQLKDKAQAQGIKKNDIKWVKPENIHLTLKFLGDVPAEKTVELCKVVEAVANQHHGFDIAIESVGSFGGRSARVLWIGASQGSDKLFELQQDMEEQLDKLGWPKETRQFSSHLTLCRIRNLKAGAKLNKIIENYKDFKAGLVSIDKLYVYQSQLTQTGPVYTVLGSYELQ